MTAVICTACGHRFERVDDSVKHPPCPVCPPNRFASEEVSPAGRYALHKWHGLVVPEHICPGGMLPACPHVTPPQSPVLTKLGIPDTQPGLQICGNPAKPDGGECDAHTPKPAAPVAAPPKDSAQLDLFGLFG